MTIFDFNTSHIYILLGLLASIFLSIYLFFKKKNEYFYFFVISTFLSGFFISTLDSFLILWDEQFHALVAKNLLNDPFHPTLYRAPLLDYDYRDWTSNHTWLHKQPLFLWQIAISLKIFGLTEFGVRFPSVILHALTSIIVFRMGKLMINEKVGFIAGLLMTISYFPLELVAGRFSTDHNDIAFLFYVSASIWMLCEYINDRRILWVYLLGIAVGCAVLTKWLTGLLALGIWVLIIIFQYFRRKSYVLQEIRRWGLSFGIACVIFLPWQIYSYLIFPLEFKHEANLNRKHFFESVESHGGNWRFHFEEGISTLYGPGDLIPYILIIGLILLYFSLNRTEYRLILFSALVLVYGFFTIAATKMLAFVLIVAPVLYLGLATAIDKILFILEKKIRNETFIRLASTLIVFICVYTAMNLTAIRESHTNLNPLNNHNRAYKLREKAFIDSIASSDLGDKVVIFNASLNERAEIPIMFYTDYVAYARKPTSHEVDMLRNHKYDVYIVNPDSVDSNTRSLYFRY